MKSDRRWTRRTSSSSSMAAATRWAIAGLFLCTSGVLLVVDAASSSVSSPAFRRATAGLSIQSALDRHPSPLLVPRGGGGGEGVKRRKKSSSSSASSGGKKRRRRSSRRSENEEDDADEEEEEEVGDEEGRRALDAAMREGDAATALGDAIRDRADVLRADAATPRPLSPAGRIDASLASVGLALGTSDPMARTQRWNENGDHEDNVDGRVGGGGGEGGGVEASPTAVLANYFLRTHGGAHGVQCLLSLLSVAAGIAALIVPIPPPSSSSSSLVDGVAASVNSAAPPAKVILLRRSLLCALAKHASGLTAAAALEARRMGLGRNGNGGGGFRGARRAAEALALDPVGQYLFYCALLLVWAPSPSSSGGGGGEGGGAGAGMAWAFWKKATAKATSEAAAAGTGAAAAAMVVPWWLSTPRSATASTLCLLGPVLLREVVSAAWVASDVSVLLATAASSSQQREPAPLRMARGAVDAAMSLLFTPAKWRDASPASRQRTLATAVSKTSLGLEVATGGLILIDAVRAFAAYALSAVAERPNLTGVIKRIVCAQLYVNFMLVRRRKITELVGDIRGGAMHVPERVLDALLEPRRAMGLDDEGKTEGAREGESSSAVSSVAEGERSWRRNVAFALGLE